MTAIRQRMRRPKATRRLHAGDLRALVRDHRAWCRLALVTKPDSGSHYELVEEDGKLAEILVEVETVPDMVGLTCKLGSCASGAGKGIWTIPSVGDEVLVAVPDGDIAFAPTIVAILGSGDIPNPTGQGPTQTRTVIVNGEVVIHNGSTGAEALVKKSEFDTFQTWADAHIHTNVASGGQVSGPPGTPSIPITGTTVLKAK